MRPYRLLAVLAITGGLWAPRDAAAVCDIAGPYLGTGTKLPLGCPLHVYSGFNGTGEPFIPKVTVLRGGAYADATGAITRNMEQISVTTTFVNCQLQPSNMMTTIMPYDHLAITPQNVQVGEQIGFSSDWLTGIEIVAAGPCAAPILPQPACTETPFCGSPPPFEDFEQSDCSAGGGGGLALGLALLGLCAARRRRR
ncbi:MAG TPA: MYXO-CTERM sorting domain-containing protein [Kofleriaceae bacterium]|nr:MYXO-CTERM sorting domain-containing protein [Kofleriaceae bacterium]